MNSNKTALILTSTIDPKGIKFLERTNIQNRYDDYKKAFIFWINNKLINNIIFIENSGYDLTFFKKKALESKKNIEVITCKINNDFDRSYGKGYGEYLSLKKIFETSKIAENNDYFIKVTGRHIIKNFNQIYKDIFQDDNEIYLNLKNNLKLADSTIFGGSKLFFTKYLIHETSKTNDSKNIFFEHATASATLKAITNGLQFSQIKVYADIDGYIGTNNKKIENNIFKKIKLFFYGKLKKFFFKNSRY